MNKRILYLLSFLIKGWEISLLLVLPVLQTQGKINVFEIGILATAFSLTQIATYFFAGHLAEKFSSKQVMTAAIIFYSLSWLILFLSSDFGTLLIAYCLGGIGQGCFVPLANSQIAKLTDKNRAQEFGDFNAFTDIGRVLLTGLTTFMIGKMNIKTTGLIYSILAAVATFVFIKTTMSATHIKDEATKLVSIKILEIIRNKRFMIAVFSGVFDVFSSASLFIFIPLLLIPKGIDISQIGFLTALFFTGYLTGRMVLSRLADKYGSIKILVISQICMAILIYCLVFLSSFWVIAFVLFIFGVFTRGTSPIIRAMMADSVKGKEKFDKAFSFYSFSLGTSNALSRSTYGFIAGILGINSVFYLSAIVAVLTLIPLYLYKSSKQYA